MTVLVIAGTVNTKYLVTSIRFFYKIAIAFASEGTALLVLFPTIGIAIVAGNSQMKI